ncbi:leucyl aminopeptidase [Brevibacillus dissolubilis]|uniref:leucyl aminopeptidase n=1 Tax=Brevibacillus dissolubilis TaxID=1844116 RepID=UPI00111788D5|nr:leucyl aminopeptidase [Brevibacillus dissolubilis]
MITIIEKKQELTDVTCDELVIGLYQNQGLEGALAQVNQRLDGALTGLLEEQEISGEAKRLSVVHTFGKLAAKKLVFIGLGECDTLTYNKAREYTAKLVKTLTSNGENKTVAIYLGEDHKLEASRLAQAVTEAFLLASYKYEGYRQKPNTKKALASVQLLVDSKDLAAATAGHTLGQAMAEGTNLARNLVNEPANYLTPTALKNEIVQVAERYSMSYEVFDKAKLTELGMGGVLAVAQGSAQEPYVVVVKYQGRETWDDVIGLIGKGVTFDTGGISIKPVAGMEEMKCDMGGSAAVIGTLEILGRLKPAVNVLMVVGTVENMPSGTAFRPGDVITMMGGKTVEIITTDAEGRLVLADCITYAKEQGVSCLIDCATLTGGIVVALGTVSSGAMTNNREMVTEVLASAEQVGERLWELPLFEEYAELNKSRFADLKNSGGRYGHAIIAGKFLEVFVEDTPWVHLDNAGTAYLNSSSDLFISGATGAMTRTIAQFVLNRSN